RGLRIDRRADELRLRHCRAEPSGRWLCRPHPEGGKARRSSSAVTGQVRVPDQREGRECARDYEPARAAIGCQRGDRIVALRTKRRPEWAARLNIGFEEISLRPGFLTTAQVHSCHNCAL